MNSPATNVYAILGLIFSFLGGISGFVFSLCGLSMAQKTGFACCNVLGSNFVGTRDCGKCYAIKVLMSVKNLYVCKNW